MRSSAIRLCGFTLLMLALSSCENGPATVVLRDPISGQIHECQGTGTVPGIQARQCAEGYQKAGWIRMN